MVKTHEKYTILEEEQQALESMLRSPKTTQSLAFRAKIILLTFSGETAEEVATHLNTTLPTIYRWRKRFKDLSIGGLHDRPRSGQPKKLSEEKVKDVLRLTVECIPHEATHWSVRLMAKAANIQTSR